MLLAKKEPVKIRSEHVDIEGILELPEHPLGIVLFAHGSGSNRFRHRNNYVAAALHAANMGTLFVGLFVCLSVCRLIDLLTQVCHMA